MLKLAIHKLMENRNLTTVAFAEGAGITPNTARALRRGDTQRIDLPTLEKVCHFFKVQPGECFEYTPEKRKP